MNKPLLLGLDLGTTNAKAAVYDPHGQLVAEAAVSYPTHFPQPGWVEQRPSDWRAALIAACRQVMNALGDRRAQLTGLALSAHGPGLVLIDADGQPLIDRSPTWQDTRCVAHGQRLLDTIGHYPAGGGTPQNTFAAKLLWLIETQPALARQTRLALSIKDYLALWLTGEAVTEPSNNVGDLAWSPTLLTALNWSSERLARVVPATTVIGALLPERADALDLPRGLPVVIGLNDGASATLSMGAITQHELVLTLATSGVLRVVLTAPIDPQVRLEHKFFAWPYVPGRWIAGAHVRAGASALQWFAQTHGAAGADLNDLLAEAATTPPGSNGVIFLPYLLGRGGPHADDTVRGSFVGLSLATTRGDLARSVLEGVALAFREILDDFAQLGYRGKQIRISGGGARSDLWRQILADVLERPLQHFAADSTLGAAISAAVGVGIHADVASAVSAMVRTTGRDDPRAENVALYREKVAEFQKWNERL